MLALVLVTRYLFHPTWFRWRADCSILLAICSFSEIIAQQSSFVQFVSFQLSYVPVSLLMNLGYPLRCSFSYKSFAAKIFVYALWFRFKLFVSSFICFCVFETYFRKMLFRCTLFTSTLYRNIRVLAFKHFLCQIHGCKRSKPQL